MLALDTARRELAHHERLEQADGARDDADGAGTGTGTGAGAGTGAGKRLTPEAAFA